jgi:hypothetical protein
VCLVSQSDSIFHFSFGIGGFNMEVGVYRNQNRKRTGEARSPAGVVLATGQGVNFTNREFQSLIAVTQVLTTTVDSLAGPVLIRAVSRAAVLGF